MRLKPTNPPNMLSGRHGLASGPAYPAVETRDTWVVWPASNGNSEAGVLRPTGLLAVIKFRAGFVFVAGVGSGRSGCNKSPPSGFCGIGATFFCGLVGRVVGRRWTVVWVQAVGRYLSIHRLQTVVVKLIRIVDVICWQDDLYNT